MSDDPSRRRFLKRAATALVVGVRRPGSPNALSVRVTAPQKKQATATVEQRVEHIIAEHLGVEEEKVVPKARLMEDLGADSLDVIELIMTCEEAFDIEIPCDEEEKLHTVQDVIDCVRSRMKPPPDTSTPHER